jgi:hypothetical protein
MKLCIATDIPPKDTIKQIISAINSGEDLASDIFDAPVVISIIPDSNGGADTSDAKI